MTLHYCDGCESIKQDAVVTENTCEHCGHWTVSMAVAPVEDDVLDMPAFHWASDFNDRVMAAWQEYKS